MKNKIIYWITTSIFFLFEGVMPALTFQTEIARNGISHLGYPLYFGTMLAFFKVAGALVLILPIATSKLKEWAYAGFTFNLVAASLSTLAVDGFGFPVFFPLIVLGILALSYVSRQKLTVVQANLPQLA